MIIYTSGTVKIPFEIDDTDLPLIIIHKWYYTKSSKRMRYLKSSSPAIYLHRLLLNPENNMDVDHIDGNTLNNKRSNLRICNRSQNIMNTKIISDNKSGHRGVYWDKKRNKWIAEIMINGHKTKLGRYENINDAINAYEEMALQNYKEYKYKETK